jgi:outer membrane protein insertion porin family
MEIERLFSIAALSLLLIPSAATAAAIPNPEEFAGRPVAQVRFEPPQQPLTSQQLADIVHLKPRAPLNPADVRSTIKQLYATGRYADVELAAEPAEGGAVNLVIHTVEQWFVGMVEVRGKTKEPPNAGQLANASRLELGQPFTDDSLKGAVDGIQDLLKRNGFYGSMVQHDMTRDPDHQQVMLTFRVKTGTRARLNSPIINGEPRIPVEEVQRATKWKGWFGWHHDTQSNVQQGLRRVEQRYEKDNRLTANVSLENVSFNPTLNRVTPTLKVVGGPKVKINAVGAKVSQGKLKRYVPVFDEQTVNRDLLVDGARNLRDYFQSQGYFDVDVDFESQQPSSDQEEIIYVINPGPRHKLVDVQVRGNRYFRTEDIRERMMLQTAGFLYLRHGRYSEGIVRRDEKNISALYQSNGFRDVKVTTQTLDEYKGKTAQMAAVVTIEEGPQYFVSEFTIEGVQQLKLAEIQPKLACIPGEPFSENNVAIDRDYLIGLYQSSGFPDATFDWKMEPGPGPHQMKVQYFIAEGKERLVREVLISGMRETRMRLVKPLVTLKAGDPLSWRQMGNMQQGLYNLGVFDKVDMAIQNPQGETYQKYVLYHLEEGHRYSVAVGAGAEFARIGGVQTSLDNPAGQAGFAPRGSFEVSRLNFLGLGHSINFKSRYSTLDRRASINYYAPRYRNVEGRNISFTALYDDARDVRTFTARRLEGSVQLSQQLSKPTSMLFRYTYRDVRVDQSTLKIEPLLIPLLSQPARIGMISTSLIQDRRDDPADAHRGVFNTIDVGLAESVFASRHNFVRFLGRNSWYHLLKKNYVLASNTSFGWLGPFKLAGGADPTQAIPLPERFFGGGSTSHRGFPDNQAGPRDPLTGFPLGGNALLFHSTELRFPLLSDNMQGVLFHDMGNIYSGPGKISFRFHQKSPTDFDYMVHAAGFGVRYRTPVGPIRVDLAYSINPPSFMGLKGNYTDLLFGTAQRVQQSVKSFQFFFSIGQAF